MRYTRREFGKLALSVVPAAALAGDFGASLMAAPAKVDSKVNGVQIGMNVPYNFSDMSMSGDDILARMIQLNCSAVELRSRAVVRSTVRAALLTGAFGDQGSGR